jgi:hypothetical protein
LYNKDGAMNEHDDAISPGPQHELKEGVFDGRAEFQGLVREVFAAAERAAWREIILCDHSFEDWPLGERAVIDSLQAWCKTGRRFTILAKRFDTLIAKHHRFVVWRKQWSHIIEARAVPSASVEEFPSAIWTPDWVANRLAPEHSRGVASREAQRRLVMREELNEWLHKSSPSFPSTTLGL